MTSTIAYAGTSSLLHCGSWVARVMKRKNIEKCIIVEMDIAGDYSPVKVDGVFKSAAWKVL